MSNIAPLTNVEEQIKDRIKSDFANLIPDEMWSDMVRSVIHDFTTDKTNRHGDVKHSPLKELMTWELNKICREKIAEELEKHTVNFDSYGNRAVAEATELMIREHLPAMLTAMQEASVRIVVEQAIQNLKSSMGVYS